MILLVAIGLGVTVGLLRGGRIWNLANLPLRATWLPIALVIFQLALVQFPLAGIGRLGSIYLPAALIALALFLIVNRSLPGVQLILVGTVLNLAVILANGGHMPVTLEALERSGHADRIELRDGRAYVLGSKDIVLSKADTNLYLLSDVLGIPEELPLSTNFSIGDVAIGLGAAILAYTAVRGTKRSDSDAVTQEESALETEVPARTVKKGA